MKRAVLFALALLAVAGVANAQPSQEKAAKEFVSGQRAFAAGDFRRAAESFEAAYRAKPHHAPLWNAARSWQKAGQDIRAANLLERYLREAPADAPDRDQATVALAEVSRRVGRIEIVRARATDVKVDDTTFDGASIWVAGGEHVVSAVSNDGKPITRRVNVEAGGVASVSLAPAELEPPVAAPPPPPRPREAPSSGLSPWFVVVSGAATLAAGGLSIASGLDTVRQRDAFRADPTPSRFEQAHASQTRTNVALGVTGGLVLLTGVTAILVDWGGRKREREPVAAHWRTRKVAGP